MTLVMLNKVKNLRFILTARFFTLLKQTRWTNLSKYSPTLLLLLLATSCTELRLLTVEQMLPPEVLPTWDRRSVGIINNFSPNNITVNNDDTSIYPCNADSVVEQIALSFANTGIMDRVVVLDSLLYPEKGTAPHLLAQAEVNDLCAYLDVDMLYSLEYACITINWSTPSIERPMNAFLCSRIYTPDCDTLPGTAISDKKVVESWVYDMAQVNTFMPDAPHMLANVAVEAYLPSWKERERVFYYDCLCYELREAKVCVYEGDWEGAAQQWRIVTQSKHRFRRYAATYNMALYYEMSDSIDEAIASLDLAKEIAVKRDEKGKEVGIAFDTSLIETYREVLVNRRKEIEELEKSLTRMR